MSIFFKTSAVLATALCAFLFTPAQGEARSHGHSHTSVSFNVGVGASHVSCGHVRHHCWAPRAVVGYRPCYVACPCNEVVVYRPMPPRPVVVHRSHYCW